MVINSITVKESNEVILLSITIDNKLVFKKHIENLCRTAQYINSMLQGDFTLGGSSALR